MPIAMYRLLVLGITTLVVVAPLSLVIYQSFLTAPFFDPSAKVGLLAYSFVLADPDFWQAFWTTIVIAGGMAAIAVPLGVIRNESGVVADVAARPWRSGTEPPDFCRSDDQIPRAPWRTLKLCR